MTEQSNPQSDGTDTRTESTEPTTFFTRRRLLKGTAGAAGIGVLGGLGLWYGTQPSLAATTSPEDQNDVVTVTTNAGEVMDVDVKPTFTLDWSDFGGGVSDFGFTIDATVGGSTATVYDASGVTASSPGSLVESFTLDSGTLDDFSGLASIECTRQSIIDGSTITTGSFPSDVSQGSSQTQGVTLELTATGNTGLGQSVSSSESTLSFDVTVENPSGTLEVSINESNATGTGADSAGETLTTTTSG